MNQDNEELVKALQNLNSNIELLTKVTALTFRKESIFKDKQTKQEQIEVLDDLKLPDNVIALIVGSTVDSVQVSRSLRKAKAKKKNESKPSGDVANKQ